MVTRLTVGSDPVRQPDELAIEEPLELRVGGRSLAVTMRTPGADFDLAAGFLVSEAVIERADQLAAMRYCAGADDGETNRFNVLDISLGARVAPPDPSVERAFFTTSSCGLCGKASIEAVRTRSAYEVRSDPLRIAPELLATFPERLRAEQKVFDKTGGLHAAALFDSTGKLLVLREDIGRHNAVDKVIGWALLEGRVPLSDSVLLVSGRGGFEIVQKAIVAGVPVVASVSAPSSLAVQLARELHLTLIGFLRGRRFVIYAGEERMAGKTQKA